MAPPLIALRDVHLTFGGTPLLTGAEFAVSAGEKVCLVGRNGSGKSTLLKIAAGLVEPDRGEHFMQPGALVRYLAQEVDFSGFTVDLDGQDEFFRRIYAAARQLRWGQTTTYGALAKELGAGPEAARDVGQAMAKNPVSLIIPCHRVLAAGGKIGGFSAPGGSTTKTRMLELEGVHLGEPAPSQQSFGF